MKKGFIICMLVLYTVTCFSQNFALTKDGFVNSKDQSKNYVVIECSGTQLDLFNKAKAYLTSIYRSPKDVLSLSSPDVITINAIESDAVYKKALGMIAISYDMNYTIVIRFKDGKIRIDSPNFILSNYSGSKTVKLILRGSANGGFGSEVINRIYNKKGKLKAKYAKKQLDKFFNSYLEELKKGINKDHNDW